MNIKGYQNARMPGLRIFAYTDTVFMGKIMRSTLHRTLHPYMYVHYIIFAIQTQQLHKLCKIMKHSTTQCKTKRKVKLCFILYTLITYRATL